MDLEALLLGSVVAAVVGVGDDAAELGADRSLDVRMAAARVWLS